LTNLLIDGAVLAVTSWVRGIRPRWPRILGSAAIGACYVMVMFVPPLAFLFTFLIKFGLSLVMIWTAFGFGSLQHFTRNTAAFYGVNFAAAGGVLGFHYLLQSSGDLWKGIWFTRTGGLRFELGIGLFYLLLSAAAGLLLYRMIMNERRRKEQVSAQLADVTVTIGHCVCHCVGLVDTGNHLYDPLTRTPVMVMEAGLWQSELPPSWMERIKDAQVDRLVAGIGREETWAWQDRLRLVPYRGVNRGTQFMLALKPDNVKVVQDGQVYETRKVLIGLDGGKIGPDGAYQAIIHPSLMQSRDV
jgi:stage II sporulation protein GA (sporulation sigma-E factor processing peptidase)